MNQAALLVNIGSVLFIIAAVTCIASQIPRTVQRTLARNKQVRAHRGDIGGERALFGFSARRPSLIKGGISGAGTGEFHVYIVRHIPGLPPLSSLDVYVHKKGPGEAGDKNIPFQREIPEGDYSVLFHTDATVEMATTFNLTLFQRIKPYGKLLDLGLTLLGVALPLLITGAVLS